MRRLCRSKITGINFNHFISIVSRYKQSYMIVNFLITMFIVFFAVSCGKVERAGVEIVDEEESIVTVVPSESENISYKSKTSFRMHMEGLDVVYDFLTLSIERQNWDEIKEYAMLLKKTSPVMFTGRRKEDLPRDFVILDTKFHLQALALAEAAQSKEMVNLNIEYDKLQQICDDCHVKYKKKE